MKRYGIVFIGVAAVAGAAFFFWKSVQAQGLCGNLRCLGMPGISAYTLTETYTDTASVYRALYTAGKRFIRIEAKKSEPNDARRDINASVTRMKALFEKAPAPYPGDISDSVVCDPAYVPSYHTEKRADGTLTYFVGYLNDRLTFGSCSGQNAQYRGIMAFTYCTREQLSLRVELIAPTGDFNSHEKDITESIRTIRCGRYP